MSKTLPPQLQKLSDDIKTACDGVGKMIRPGSVITVEPFYRYHEAMRDFALGLVEYVDVGTDYHERLARGLRWEERT